MVAYKFIKKLPNNKDILEIDKEVKSKDELNQQFFFFYMQKTRNL